MTPFKFLNEAAFTEAERRRLCSRRHMPELAGAWPDALVDEIREQNVGQLPNPYSAADVVDCFCDAGRPQLIKLFHALDKSLRLSPPALNDSASQRWALELTCLNAGRSMDWARWAAQSCKAELENSEDALATLVESASNLVATVGLSRMLGLALVWDDGMDHPGMIDLSDHFDPMGDVLGILRALDREIARLEGRARVRLGRGPIQTSATDSDLPALVGRLRDYFDRCRLDKEFAGVYIKLPEVWSAQERLDVLAELAQHLNTTVAGHQAPTGSPLVHPAAGMTVESFKAKLERIFSMLAAPRAATEPPAEPSKGPTAPPTTSPTPAATPTAPNPPTEAPKPPQIKLWDLFISHASEDKATLVDPLVAGLEAVGLRVWYDRREMALGDSLVGKIQEGLEQSNFCVVLFSPAYLRKQWTQAELRAQIARQINRDEKRILPLVTFEPGVDGMPELPALLQDRLYATYRHKDDLPNVIRQVLAAVNRSH